MMVSRWRFCTNSRAVSALILAAAGSFATLEQLGEHRDSSGFVHVEQPILHPISRRVSLLVCSAKRPTRAGTPLPMHMIGRVHFQTEQARRPHDRCSGLVGQPVTLAPDDFIFHIIGQRVIKLYLRLPFGFCRGKAKILALRTSPAMHWRGGA